jgi:hypothetical protein
MAVVNLELPLFLLLGGLACALIAWLLGTFTQHLREYRYRVSLGLIAFPLSGLMGFVSTLNAVSAFGDWFAGKPISFVIGIGIFGYLVFGFLGCWTVLRLAGRMDRKHTLDVLYNLVKEHKNRDTED